ncbi:MAG: protein-L-isoaspartate(D-aspartate) O-methyltransferase [Chloroflexi bacterium]|nr:protein-L-isoaspartate(D-aspartate) O-methyltransferase [Chloroflexota bacterium]
MSKFGFSLRDVRDERVIAAMERVPRHLFVPEPYVPQAYGDHPLPIGYGQTISQPYIVAVMTELLQPEPTDKILEVGAGSGYQAAILAELVARVYTIEIIPALAQEARERLARLGYTNVEVIEGDGYLGYPEQAPYDGIIVTCAPDHIPPPLVEQLADGARLVIPVGPAGYHQDLWVVERHGAEVRSRKVMGVAFVPLVRRPGGHPQTPYEDDEGDWL